MTWEQSATELLNQKLKDQMAKIDAGMPKHLAAAEIGLMPFEFDGLCEVVKRREAAQANSR